MATTFTSHAVYTCQYFKGCNYAYSEDYGPKWCVHLAEEEVEKVSILEQGKQRKITHCMIDHDLLLHLIGTQFCLVCRRIR